ncbi:metallophosphoesterase [Alkaliphilus crotonatoxidans]
MKNIKSNKRRELVTVLLIFLVPFSIWVYWGNTSILTTQIHISSKSLPVSFNGFRIVHVSDLHNTEFGVNQEKLLDAVKNASPDLIAITGDLIDSRRTDLLKAMDFVNGAVKIAPVYYVTGNHEARIDEYLKLEEKMAEAGVVLLRDKGVTIERGEDFIRLLGLDDPSFMKKNDKIENSITLTDAKLKDLMDENQYTILLSHRPELFNVYAAHSIDLILSGHAHGGQVRLPFVGGLVAPNQGLFPKYDEGIYEIGPSKMVVSRGLGNSIFPVRINNRPELVVITLGQ